MKNTKTNNKRIGMKNGCLKSNMIGDFITEIDDITVGAIEGRSFDMFNDDCPTEYKMKWALSKYYFYEQLAAKLKTYHDLVQEESKK